MVHSEFVDAHGQATPLLPDRPQGPDEQDHRGRIALPRGNGGVQCGVGPLRMVWGERFGRGGYLLAGT
jgi:hypothetical protein